MRMGKLQILAAMGLLFGYLTGKNSTPSTYHYTEPKHRQRTRGQHLARMTAAQQKRDRENAKRARDFGAAR